MLGPYEIVSQLGAGGMGEVYRAIDKRLDRTVAIKVLPSEFSANAHLKLRFEREARAISQLSHPNICTLHDIGNSDGVDYLVMEHIDGEVLADRIARGPLPLDDVLRYSTQIADALEKAHRSGIVHRDLKPGNVMLTRSGAKLLDFGLAKAFDPGTPSGVTAGVTHLLTEQKPLTDQGTLIGTVQYMSPEQLEGRDADARSDIFALGLVMYEMLTGRRAFVGKSKASLIAAILATEPPAINAVQPLTPPAMERIINICLEKDPDDRWQSAHDLKLELQGIAEGVSGVIPQSAAPSQARKTLWPLLALALALAAAVGYIAYDRARLHRIEPPSHLVIAAPEKERFNPYESAASISPDGTKIVVRIDGGEQSGLALRSLDSFDFKMLPGTNDSYEAFWSPDGKQIGYFGLAKLRRVDVTGGSPRVIASVGDSRGGSWGADDVIVFSPSVNGPIQKVKATGGPVTAVTKLDPARKETGHWRPQFLPDGKHFLFTVQSSDAEMGGIYAGSVDGMTPKRILDVDSSAIYAGGYLLYVDNDTLYAQRFDPDKLATNGEPAVLANNVDMNRIFMSPGYAATASTLVYHPRGSVPLARLTRVDRATRTKSDMPDVTGRNLDLSRDGSRIAMEHIDQSSRTTDIWTYDLKRGTRTRITHHGAPDTGPVWSPDGGSVLWQSYRDGWMYVLRRHSAGTGNEDIVLRISGDDMTKKNWFGLEVTDWSLDGRSLLMEIFTIEERGDFAYIDLNDPKREIRLLSSSPFNEHSPRFSPDGKWISYTSNESGAPQIYIQPFPPNGGKWQISTDGGNSSRWRRDVRELYFVSRDNKLMAVDIAVANGEIVAGKPQPIADSVATDIVVTPDGQTMFVASAETLTAPPLHVITNWRTKLPK